ncbi:MAG: RrF2 family transcriptional regulator [Anaerolineales bacterium]
MTKQSPKDYICYLTGDCFGKVRHAAPFRKFKESPNNSPFPLDKWIKILYDYSNNVDNFSRVLIMRLSKRGEYGMRAMIFLASQKAESDVHFIQIKEIAEREQIPAKFLEQILLTLKNAGLVNSKMGVNGGYYLSKPAHEITLGQIFRVLDGPLAPIRCVSQMAYEPCGCPDEESCGLRLVMLDVRNAISNILDNTSLAQVAKRVEQVRNNKQHRL